MPRPIWSSTGAREGAKAQTFSIKAGAIDIHMFKQVCCMGVHLVDQFSHEGSIAVVSGILPPGRSEGKPDKNPLETQASVFHLASLTGISKCNACETNRRSDFWGNQLDDS